MSLLNVNPSDARATRRLSRHAAFWLQASLVVAFLAGSSAPTPLYCVYQGAWGFSSITVTIVFGVYAVAVLASLLVTGSLSDHVGRRPVLLVATVMQVIAMAMFASAHGLGMLIAARIVQGVSTGAAAAAVGAGMVDLDRAKGTIANAVAPMTGTATGALVSGLLVQYAPHPTLLVYVLLGAAFVAQAVALVFMPETVTRRGGALASLRPRFRLPLQVRQPMLVAVPALIAAWSLAGFYGSLGPVLVRRLVGSSSLALGGIALFVLAASGAVTVFVMRARTAHSMMTYGAAALAAGVSLTLLAMATASAPTFFAGALLAGSGFGASFQAAIRLVMPLAAPDERAGVLSIIYVVAYLAMGIPAVFAGLRVVHGGGVMTTAREYGLCVIALAGAALVGAVRRTRALAVA